MLQLGEGVILLNKRCLQILKIIVQNETVEMQNFLSELKVSKRTLYYDLNNIGAYLKKNNMPELQKNRMGVSLKLTESQYSFLFSKISNNNYDYILSKDERQNIIINELIRANDFVTIDYIADKINVSRSTVLSDLKFVKEWSKKKGCDIVSKPSHGIRIVGRENDIRKIIIKDIFKKFSNDDLLKIIDNHSAEDKIKFIVNEFSSYEEFIYIKKCVTAAENELEIFFSDQVFFSIVLHIAMMIKRIKVGQKIFVSKIDMKEIEKTQEFVASYNISKLLENYLKMRIPTVEIAYIAQHFLEVSNVDAKYIKDPNLIIYQTFVSGMINKMCVKTGINLIDDDILWNGLISHIKPVFYRLKHRQNLENPLLNEIKNMYQKSFQYTKEAVRDIELYFNVELSDDEAAYFALHFEASIDRNKRAVENKKNVVIVCNSGIGTARILQEKIVDIFNANVLQCAAYRNIDKVIEKNRPDLVVTTVPVRIMKEVPTVQVNPLLQDSDLHKLNQYLSFKNNDGPYMQETFKKIMELVGRNCVINNAGELCSGLEKILNFSQHKNIKRKSELMLKDVLTEKTIRLNVKAKDWEDSIKIGGQLLVEQGIASTKYVDAMVNSVRDIGPYMVIAPGFAMPHARPESGAIKTGFSMITLADPVIFGSEKNDPVYLVVCVCSIDNKSHVKALSELIQFLGDDENMELIKKAKKTSEIIEKFNQQISE